MLYINKTKPPRTLLKYIAQQKSAGLHPSYKNLRGNYVENLDVQLFEEQKDYVVIVCK